MTDAAGDHGTEDEGQVVDVPERGRFELRVGDQAGEGVAYAEYRLVGDALLIAHTEVPETLEGRGLGGRLVRGVLEAAQAKGLKVIPMCPFAAAYIRDHPDYRDLVHPVHRAALGI